MSLHRDLAVKKQIGSSEGKSFHLCKYIILRSLQVRNTGPQFVYSPPCFHSAHDWPHTHSRGGGVTLKDGVTREVVWNGLAAVCKAL